MTVAQLNEHMTISEFLEWMAYDEYRVEKSELEEE